MLNGGDVISFIKFIKTAEILKNYVEFEQIIISQPNPKICINYNALINMFTVH